MRFSELTAHNFGTLQDISLPLDRQGLVLVTGRNLDAPKADSNGAGKSLLLDAFAWCLWGSTVRGIKDDAVVHEGVGKDCVATVEFEDAGNTYLVKRYRQNTHSRKPNDLELWINGEEDSGVSIASTQSKIVDILGLDFITFCVMMPGADLKASELTDKQIKLLLERLLQTDAAEVAYQAALAQRKEAQIALQAAETKKTQLESSIEHSEQLMSNYATSRDTFQEKKQHRLAALEEDLDELRAEIDECASVVSQSSRIDDKWYEANKRLKKAQARALRIYTQHTQLQAEYQQNRDKYRQELTSLDLQTQHATDALARVEALGPECVKCEQPVDDSHREAIVAKYTTELDALTVSRDTLTQEALQAQEDFEQEIAQSAAQLETVRAEEQLHQADVSQLGTQKDKIKAALVEKQKLQQREEKLRNQHADTFSEENPFDSLINELVCSTAKDVADHARQLAEITRLDAEYKTLDFWTEGFSPKGIRSYLLEHVTPALNASASKYSQILTEGEMEITFHTSTKLKNGKVKENFRIQVEQKHGGSSYKSNSKGEQGRANLVIAFALGDLAALRANKRIPFRFLDEPFENIDESGIEGVLSLLQEARDKYETVFVITHNDHFKKLFQKEVCVVKEHGFSSLEN